MKDKRRAIKDSKHLHTVFSTAIMILALSLPAGCGLGKGGQESVSDGEASTESETGTLADLAARNSSDPDAAVYYLAKMLYAGESVTFVARRIMICASEDVANADPQALQVAVAAAQAVERVGMPESQLILAHAAIYVASAPKSNAVTNAIFAATNAVKKYGGAEVPPHLRDAHYGGAKELGHVGYLYAHDFPNHYVKQQYLPDPLVGSTFYEPTEQGKEAEIKKWLESLRQKSE